MVHMYLNEDPPGISRRETDYSGGFGLFADRQFDKDEYIINYRGLHVDEAEAGPYVYNYALNGTTTKCIDAGDENSGLGRFINDIDPFTEANCEAKILRYYTDDTEMMSTIYFRALHDINIGEFYTIMHCFHW